MPSRLSPASSTSSGEKETPFTVAVFSRMAASHTRISPLPLHSADQGW